MYLPLPMFMLRRLVRRYPWLLAEGGGVTRSRTLNLGPLELGVESGMKLAPRQRAKLLAEADAGARVD